MAVNTSDRWSTPGPDLASVLDAAPEALALIETDGRIVSWNRAAEAMLAWTSEQAVEADIGELLLAHTGPAQLREELARLAVGGIARLIPHRLELVAVHRSGRELPIELSLTVVGPEDRPRIVAFFEDVSEPDGDAERLAEAESRFAGAFEAASTGMALTAPDGRFLAVNRALCQFLGRDAETLLASCVQAVTHPDDLAADVEQGQRALAGEIDSFQQPKRYILPSGGIVWGLLTISVSRDAHGAPQHYVSQVQDITDRKTSEAELRRYAGQLQALSEQDALTGLLNQRTFHIALEEELRVHDALGGRCSVVLAQVDGDDDAVTAAAEVLQHASRDADLSAHLGNGELAVLLPNVDARTAAEIGDRIGETFRGRGAYCSQATARLGEDGRGLLQRARDSLPRSDRPPPGGARPAAPDGITRLLELARDQLGMPIAFLTRLHGDDYVFVRFAGDHDAFGIAEGDAMSLADSYCQRMLDGRLASTAPDLAANSQTRDLDLTWKLGLRAYAGVPVRLRSGEIYGTLCTVDTHPHPELGERQAELLGFLGDLAAELIEDEADRPATRRAQAGAAGVRTLLLALQARDFYTSAHSKQVVELASAVALRLGLDRDETRDIEQVALLHDIGKVGIPDAILQKQGPLDEQEWQLMRQHPVVGEHIIAGTPGLSHLAPAIRAEHEHWDGGGYPDGLSGRRIPLASRITLACDALNAMTSDRPYRPAMTLELAQQELRACAGTHFDPVIIQALLAEIATSPGESAQADAGRIHRPALVSRGA